MSLSNTTKIFWTGILTVWADYVSLHGVAGPFTESLPPFVNGLVHSWSVHTKCYLRSTKNNNCSIMMIPAIGCIPQRCRATIISLCSISLFETISSSSLPSSSTTSSSSSSSSSLVEFSSSRMSPSWGSSSVQCSHAVSQVRYGFRPGRPTPRAALENYHLTSLQICELLSGWTIDIYRWHVMQ